jgi:hypothetical protein
LIPLLAWVFLLCVFFSFSSSKPSLGFSFCSPLQHSHTILFYYLLIYLPRFSSSNYLSFVVSYSLLSFLFLLYFRKMFHDNSHTRTLPYLILFVPLQNYTTRILSGCCHIIPFLDIAGKATCDTKVIMKCVKHYCVFHWTG